MSKFYNYNLNMVNFAGRLTSPPRFKVTANGNPVITFNLAINRLTTKSDGTKKENTLFIDCKAWNRQAESLIKFLDKGTELQVTGHLECYRPKNLGSEVRAPLKYEVVVDSYLVGPNCVKTYEKNTEADLTSDLTHELTHSEKVEMLN